MMLLQGHARATCRGKRAVVVGRSNIVGKPMAQLLLARLHRHHRPFAQSGPAAICREADILVAAVGRPRDDQGRLDQAGRRGHRRRHQPRALGRSGQGRRGQDQASSATSNFKEALPVAGAITPVPGGVGPMTIACLLANTAMPASGQCVACEPSDFQGLIRFMAGREDPV
jgi:methylenetetrahydrofolate dehydrogenase (NADP+)/methenyltetrahydrofolate cyclohydrolase